MSWLMTDIWLILKQHWALFHVHQVPAHLGAREQMGDLFPLGDSSRKLSSFKANFLHPVFASSCCWSHSGHWFLEKVQHHSCSRDQPNHVCLYGSTSSLPPNPLCLVFVSAQLDHPHSGTKYYIKRELGPELHVAQLLLVRFLWKQFIQKLL